MAIATLANLLLLVEMKPIGALAFKRSINVKAFKAGTTGVAVFTLIDIPAFPLVLMETGLALAGERP